MKYRLIDGILYNPLGRIVTTDWLTYEGRSTSRRGLIWFLAFSEWPQGYVYSIDGRDHPSSLRVRLAKDLGRFTPTVRNEGK